MPPAPLPDAPPTASLQSSPALRAPLPHEAALHYPWADALPGLGDTLELANGVHWLRMPLPFALDHINLWMLRDELETPSGTRQGWTLVDCGVDSPPTRAAWEQIFATRLQGLPVLRVLVTHMHPDHVGLAHWLTQRWSSPSPTNPANPAAQGQPEPDGAAQCALWMSATDWYAARLSSSRTQPQGTDAVAFYQRHGLQDPAMLEALRGRRGHYADLVPHVPAHYHRLQHGQRLRIGGHDWDCLAGYGHAPEHIAFHCPERALLIGGDMVLPRISTNVSVWDNEPEGNPLAQFLDSLSAMTSLPAQTLVLPSHGKPFTGLHLRLQQLQEHHAERLQEVLLACQASACSAADLLGLLFKRKLDAQQTPFAMGEALAHLHALRGTGQLRTRLGADGVLRFEPTATTTPTPTPTPTPKATTTPKATAL